MYPEDVDGATKYFMSSDEFKNMDKEDKADEMKTLLNLYQNNNIIKNVYYDEPNKMFSFEYNFGDIKGTLGGVMLKDWDPMMN